MCEEQSQEHQAAGKYKSLLQWKTCLYRHKIQVLGMMGGENSVLTAWNQVSSDYTHGNDDVTTQW